MKNILKKFTTYPEKRLIFSCGKNVEIMINDKADKVIKKIFRSILFKYQNTLFDSADI